MKIVQNNELMEVVKLLRDVKKHVETTYGIDVQTLRIEIDDTGILKVFSGDELADAYLLELDLEKEELTYDNIVACIEGDYDFEVREDLVEKICEEILPNISTEALKRISIGSLCNR